MTTECSKFIASERWDQAAADYELGHKHAVQIARELGVSPATVSREFKRRGCIKASRIAETIAEIEARLDAEAEVRARSKAARNEARTRALNALVDELMDVIEAAGKHGDLTTANPDIARIDKALQLAMR
ncbi:MULTISPECIES: helix-turn-helix domain-containing protein [Sphingomonas]|uniref:helix-turn-helix domain-containing protein n=1 Tax=Sphingomonas TaxID=13687 RepID=UPI000DF01CEC|nr:MULTISPECIES: helix-turn-helix domain-containing protein [Sphingomonas]